MSVPEGMADVAATASLHSDVAQKLEIDALRQTLSGGKDKEAKLREACQGFESVFISKLFSQMRATVPKDGLLRGQYEDQYYSMFDKAMCDKMAEAGGIGLADMMYRQLKGKVLGGGADRQLLRAAGVQELDALYELQTDDGAVITVRNRVLVEGDDPRTRYARSVVRAEVAVGPHAWITRRVLVGTLESLRPERPAVRVTVYVLD